MSAALAFAALSQPRSRPLSQPRAPPRVRRAALRPRAAQPPGGGGGEFTRRAFDAVGAWLVAHPAPLWVVNNPFKRWVTTRSAGPYDAAATRAKLQALIASDGVVLFSATYCPFSFRVKQELRDRAVPYTAYETNVLPDGRALVAELGALTGRTSIPALFIGGVFIGGCNDGNPGLRPLIAAGGLEAALARCGPEWQQRRKRALAKASSSS